MLPYLIYKGNKFMNLKEKANRKKFKSSETSQLLYKQLYTNSSFNIKRKISLKFIEKNKNIYSTRLVNRCLMSDRSRGIFSRIFKMSRYSFRMMSLKGKIPGIRKGF